MTEKFKREPSQFAEYELLLKILHVISSYKYRIFFIAMIGTSIVVGLSLLVENKFTATSVVAINLNDKRGGVSPDSYRGNTTINVLEYDLIVDQASEDERDRHLARLQSFGFISEFVSEYKLLPIIFSNNWDSERQVWIDGSVPDMRDAVDSFVGSYLSIGKFGKTDMITVSITSNSGSLSADLSVEIIKSYNEYNRDRELDVLNERKNYLENRLSQVSSKETQLSIYRLLESQIAVESLLFARKNYPLEIIRPAIIPKFKSYPKRKVWAVGSFIGLIFTSIFGVFFFSLLGALKRDLDGYSRVQTERSSLPDESTLAENDWIDDVDTVLQETGINHE